MKSAACYFDFSMRIECPYCRKSFDLVDQNDDCCYSEPIFKNDWDALKGEEVTCPQCEKEFLIEEVTM